MAYQNRYYDDGSPNRRLSIRIEVARAGPIPKANKIVPTPATPPNNHPRVTAVTSIIPLTQAMGDLVIRISPVINPSLGPGPRLAIR